MTGDHNNNDPLVDKIDALIALLRGCRATLVQVGDPRAAAEAASARTREIISKMLTGKGDGISTEEIVVASRLHETLAAAAMTRAAIEETVDRLHAALVAPGESEPQIRERVSRYLATLIEKLRWDKDGQCVTPEDVADRMIDAIAHRWPHYGARLRKRRTALLDRMAKLAARHRGNPGKGKGHGQTAEQLREEILSWMFESGSREAIRKAAKRREKRRRK